MWSVTAFLLPRPNTNVTVVLKKLSFDIIIEPRWAEAGVDVYCTYLIPLTYEKQ